MKYSLLNRNVIVNFRLMASCHLGCQTCIRDLRLYQNLQIEAVLKLGFLTTYMMY